MPTPPTTPTIQHVYEQQAQSESPLQKGPAVYRPRIRRNFSRSKAGCLTCRSRRKKCDEQEATCGGCLKKNVECLWPNLQPKKSQNDDPDQRTSSGSEQDNSTSDLQTPKDDSNAVPNQQAADIASKAFQNAINRYATSLESSSLRLFGTLSQAPISLPDAPNGFWSRCGLFDGYLSNTATQLGVLPDKTNHFIYCILPLAFSDKLVMNCVLALAGAHIGCFDAVDEEAALATSKHYSSALHDLQLALCSEQKAKERNPLQLLLITSLLCKVEVISGKSHAIVLHHLRVYRQLVLSLLSKSTKLETEDDRNLWGLLHETYCYRALIASLTPRGSLEGETITLDPFLGTLWSLTQYKTSGIFLGCGHGIFEFIPEIARLANRRLAEEAEGIFIYELEHSYRFFASKLRAWLPLGSGPEITSEKVAGALIFQHALLIYLHSVFCPSLLGNAALLSEVDLRVEVSLPLLLSVAGTPLEGIMLWPVMMISSCVTKEWHREFIRAAFKGSRYKMKNVKSVVELLSSVWEDEDPRALGPRGLDFMMRKMGWNLWMT